MARKHFESKGEYPSEQKIREFIGFGSDGTIHQLNNEILAEIRMEALNKSVYIPPELQALWMASSANKADEMNAVISLELEEKDESLKAAIDQLEELNEQKSEVESQFSSMQANLLELNDSILKERTAREATESSLKATITAQTKSQEKITSERDELLEKNQQLLIDSARHEEAARHKTAEIKRLNATVDCMQDELQLERGKAAVAKEKIEWLTKSLDQKTDEVKGLSNMEHNMIEQFAILHESLLSNKTAPKSSASGRSKSASKPKANG